MHCLEKRLSNRRGAILGYVAAFAFAFALPSQAGSLQFHDASVGPGQVMLLPAPASNEPVDLDVNPQTAEGGGFYGFSELMIQATGDLTIEASGFGCQAVSCLYYPLPFVAGASLVVTAGDDLGGAFSATQDVLTFSVSGTNGYLVIAAGEYIDATGSGGDPGNPQTLTAAPFVEVPEPSLLTLLIPGLLTLAGVAAQRRSQTRP